MPDTQILNSSNAVNTTITTTEANTKTVQKPPGTPHSEALSSKTPTFSDSLQQALDEANVVQQDRIEQTVDGNDLPLVDEMNENVAEDDLSFITVNLTNTDNPTLFL